MQITRCDKKGRLYLKESVRSRYGSEFVVVETPREVVLIPVPEDPVKDLEELGKPLAKYSLKALRKRILERAREEARA